LSRAADLVRGATGVSGEKACPCLLSAPSAVYYTKRWSVRSPRCCEHAPVQSAQSPQPMPASEVRAKSHREVALMTLDSRRDGLMRSGTGRMRRRVTRLGVAAALSLGLLALSYVDTRAQASPQGDPPAKGKADKAEGEPKQAPKVGLSLNDPK